MFDIIQLGKIELGNTVIVTDPCYEIGTWCTYLINTMKPGTYEASVAICNDTSADWRSGRIAVQYVLPNGMTVEDFNKKAKEYSSIGVDSGTAGIFDFEYFKEVQETKDDHYKDEKFYNARNQASPVWTIGTPDKKGIVTSSGIGDGGYTVSCIEENGEIIAISLVFIDTDDSDNDSDEDVLDYATDDYVVKKEDIQVILSWAKRIHDKYSESQGTTALSLVADEAADLCETIMNTFEDEGE